MVRKLETKGTLQTQPGAHRRAVTGNRVLDVRRQILASAAKSLRLLSQETGMSCSSCHMTGQIHPHRVIAVQEPQPPGMQKRVASCQWFKTFIAHRGHDVVF
jgi:hypothetical protein